MAWQAEGGPIPKAKSSKRARESKSCGYVQMATLPFPKSDQRLELYPLPGQYSTVVIVLHLPHLRHQVSPGYQLGRGTTSG